MQVVLSRMRSTREAFSPFFTAVLSKAAGSPIPTIAHHLGPGGRFGAAVSKLSCSLRSEGWLRRSRIIPWLSAGATPQTNVSSDCSTPLMYP